MGDGVLAYFGWPQAHEETTPSGRCGAGLALVQTVGRALRGRPAAGCGAPPDRDCDRACGGWRVGGRGRGAGSAPWSARRRTLPPGCRRLPRPAASSSASATRRPLVGGLQAEPTTLVSTRDQRLPQSPWVSPAFVVEGEGSRWPPEALHGHRVTTPLIGREHELAIAHGALGAGPRTCGRARWS